MSDFKIRKPRRDIDIYDYYHRDREEKEQETGKGDCPWCRGRVEKEDEFLKYFVCTRGIIYRYMKKCKKIFITS